jgi:hypothetical protein
MYEFSFPPSTEKTINTALGTPDLHWKGLPRPASDTAKIRVFVHQGKVVYAFSNAFLFDGPSNGPYATPDSIVHDANDLTCRVLIE